MAGRPAGEKRKARCLMATDAEWAVIHEDAGAERLSVSEYVVRVLLDWRELKGSMGAGSG